MRDVQIRGTTDPDSIAAVLAVLQRIRSTPAPTVGGTAAWRVRRRAALARAARTQRH